MNKTIISIIVVALIGAGGYLYYQKNNDNNAGKNTTNEITKKILTGGADWDSVKCVYHNDLGNGENLDGVVYFSDGKMRNDYVYNKNNGQKSEAHMLDDGEKTYIWGTDQMYPGFDGIIMDSNYEEESMMGNDENTPNFDYEELKENNFQVPGMECEETDLDSDLFEAPSNLKFKDMQKMMESAMNFNKKMTNDLAGFIGCDVCEDIEVEADKVECLASCK